MTKNYFVTMLFVLMQVLSAPAAYSESEGGNPDGFSLIGDWKNTERTLKLPGYSKDEIEKIKSEIENLVPDYTLTYTDLFDPRDQKAFDLTQVNLVLMFHIAGKELSQLKQAFVRGVLSLHRFQDKSEYQLQSIAKTYKQFMKERMNNVVRALDPGNQILYRHVDRGRKYTHLGEDEGYFFRKDSNGMIETVVRAEMDFEHYSSYYNRRVRKHREDYDARRREIEQMSPEQLAEELNKLFARRSPDAPKEKLHYKHRLVLKEVVFGSVKGTVCEFTSKDPYSSMSLDKDDLKEILKKCGWHYVDYDGTFFGSVEKCYTEVCVLEIQNIALEIQELAFSLNDKVKFKKWKLNEMKLLCDNPQNPLLRQTVNRYSIDQVTKGDSQNVRNGLIGVTSPFYVEPLVVSGFNRKFKKLDVSLNFEPNYFQSRFMTTGWGSWIKKYERTKLNEKLEEIAKQRLERVIK